MPTAYASRTATSTGARFIASSPQPASLLLSGDTSDAGESSLLIRRRHHFHHCHHLYHVVAVRQAVTSAAARCPTTAAVSPALYSSPPIAAPKAPASAHSPRFATPTPPT